MNYLATILFAQLPLATLWLCLATLATWLLLRMSRTVSPAVHRLAWCAVLLVGWSFMRLPIAVPWYGPVEPVEPVSVATGESDENIATSNQFEIATPADELNSEPGVSAPGVSLADVAADALPIISDNEPGWSTSIAAAPVTATADMATPKTQTPPNLSPWQRFDLHSAILVTWLAGMTAIALFWLGGF